MSRHRILLRRHSVHVVGALLLLLLALGCCSYAVTHFADTLTLTVKMFSNTLSNSPETTIFARTFHDESLVRHIQGEINGIPAMNPFRNPGYTLGGTNPTYVYAFHFTWLGLRVQDASTTSQDSYPWMISTFGIGSDFIPRVADDGFLARLAKQTGMPLHPQNERSAPNAQSNVLNVQQHITLRADAATQETGQPSQTSIVAASASQQTRA